MLEEYSKFQALVQKEARAVAEQVYKENATKYGVAKVPLHRHNGFDSPKIRIQDIDGMLGSSGSITMSTDDQRYYIGLNVAASIGITPSVVRFNGIVVNSDTAPTIRTLVQGDAFIGTSFYNQPGTSSSVVVGGTGQAVVQSSSYLMINNSGSGNATRAQVSEGHIVSVTSPVDGTIVARATIPDFGNFGADDGPIQNGRLAVDVTLASGWHIIGNWQLS